MACWLPCILIICAAQLGRADNWYMDHIAASVKTGLGLVKHPDRPKAPGLQVLGAGLGRTGTASLQEALEILGYRTYHMKEVLIHGTADLWRDALERQSVDRVVPMLLEGGFNASVADLSVPLVKQLRDRFPEAKVILTTRQDSDAWLSSLLSLYEVHDLFSQFPWSILPSISSFHTTMAESVARSGCNMDVLETQTAEECLQWHKSHIAKIREVVPREQLLEYSVEQGWAPLCEFLGVPQPDIPFPRVNDREGLASSTRFLRRGIAFFWTLPVLGTCLWVGYNSWRTRIRNMQKYKPL
mmetsp:Transcript_46834/g.111436  ORF Transcript_46834/g.111436 Transcript_46834/m.111436 type:complete len:299 (-) Transcript_46834:54-950(-)